MTLISENGTADDAYEELSTAFKDNEIVALTLTIIAINAWNRLRIGLEGPSHSNDAAARLDVSAVADPKVLSLAAQLERLEAEIVQARADYRAATDGPPSPRYYESGSIHPELDDQTITPFG